MSGKGILIRMTDDLSQTTTSTTEAVIQKAAEEGKHSVPVHPEPLVCKPKYLPSWRIYKIMAEFVDGFSLLKKHGLAATFFGSARLTVGEKYYTAATELGARLSKRGFAIITGGAEGIMRAANEGAFNAGGASIGLNIKLPMEQKENKFLNDSMTFDHFFVRKVMLTFASEVYVYFPGGFGTMDEFFEIITLVQTKKILPIPIVLYGKEFWGPLDTMFREHLGEKYQAISPEDTSLYHIVDTVDEAFDYIVEKVRC